MLRLQALRLLLPLAALLLAACGGAPTETTAPTQAPAAATEQPAAPAATEAPAAEAAADGPFAGIPRSRTAEGYHVLGAADAPVTLVMYSDFL